MGYKGEICKVIYRNGLFSRQNPSKNSLILPTMEGMGESKGGKKNDFF
ncbi:hypothetical protein FACS189498_1330 [Spirochaetia bacterium]|nr:hypothetical protein FACS189498_1330 [Spirochaetia bacterium]